MAKVSFVLVLFSLVLALPLRSVLGQEDSWKDLIGEGGFSEDGLEQAKKAFGGSSGQDGADDEPQEGSSLADLLDSENNTSTDTGISPAGPTTDSPVGAPEDLPSDDVYDSSPVGAPEDSFSPVGAPQNSPTEAPKQAPTNAPINDVPTNAPLGSRANNAPKETPEFAPTNAATETPESAPRTAPKAEEEDDDDDLAPTGEPDDEFDNVDDNERAPTNAPTEAPEAEPADESESDVE